ncbi:MAG: heparinase II/III family protein [Planctomycetes bacterium]|nr:heparinase II/III family protein [Planctomycetota bacterium]
MRVRGIPIGGVALAVVGGLFGIWYAWHMSHDAGTEGAANAPASAPAGQQARAALPPFTARVAEAVRADDIAARWLTLEPGNVATAQRWLRERSIDWNDGTALTFAPGEFPPWYGAAIPQYRGEAWRKGWMLAHSLPWIPDHLAAFRQTGDEAHLRAVREVLENFFSVVHPEDGAGVADNQVHRERAGPFPWRGLVWEPSGTGSRIKALLALMVAPEAPRVITPLLDNAISAHLAAALRYRGDEMPRSAPTNHLWWLATDQAAFASILRFLPGADEWAAGAAKAIQAMLDRTGFWLPDGPPAEMFSKYFAWEFPSLLAAAHFVRDEAIRARCVAQGEAFLRFIRAISTDRWMAPLNTSPPFEVTAITDALAAHNRPGAYQRLAPGPSYPALGEQGAAGLYALRLFAPETGDLLILRARSFGYRVQHDTAAVWIASGGEWVVDGVGAPEAHTRHHAGYGDRDLSGDPRGMNTVSLDGEGQIVTPAEAAAGPPERMDEWPGGIRARAVARLPRGAVHRRTAAVLAGRAWLVVDEVTGRPSGVARAKFQFGPKYTLRRERGGFLALNAATGAPALFVTALGWGEGEVVTGRTLTPDQQREACEPELEGFYAAPTAEGIAPAPALIFKAAAALPFTGRVLFAPAREATRLWALRADDHGAITLYDGDERVADLSDVAR